LRASLIIICASSARVFFSLVIAFNSDASGAPLGKFATSQLCLHPEDANPKLIARYKEIGFIQGTIWTHDQTKRLLMYASLESLLPSAAELAT
jgi:hypothetical protein